MRVLFLSPNQEARWNPGHQHFRNEIAKWHDTVLYGPGFRIWEDFEQDANIPSMLRRLSMTKDGWKPEIIMTYGLKYTWQFQGLGEISIPKIHFVCDFTPQIPGWPGNRQEYVSLLNRDKYQLLFVLSYQARDWLLENRHEKVHYLPFGVDHKFFCYMPELEFKRDIYVGWSHYGVVYPKRPAIEAATREIAELKRYSVLIGRSFGKAFVRNMNQSRIIPNMGNAFGTMNMKHFEVFACRGLLFTDPTQELIDLGFVDGQDCVLYNDVAEYKEKVIYYLEHPNEAELIRINGWMRTKKGHTNEHRVYELMSVINKTL